jgi:hypothetical protein
MNLYIVFIPRFLICFDVGANNLISLAHERCYDEMLYL